MKQLFLIISVAITSVNAHCQGKSQFKNGNVKPYGERKSTAQPQVILENPHLHPFFGEIPRTEEQIKQDEAFVADCKKNFKSKAEASQFFASRAWDYLATSQMDTAVHRFNLAWLLNDDNVEVYWGLGVVSYQKGNLVDAIRFMEKGRRIDPSNVTLLVDLATVRLKCFMNDAQTAHLKEANELLEKATKLSPDFAEAYQKWSLTAFQEGKFDQAWIFFHKSYTLEPESIDQNFLTELLGKQPDPKGVFKKVN
jgi:tetratricopeptide (TPR) repeat protein